MINVKMRTIVGILTFTSRINTANESFKARKIYVLQDFSCYEKLKFMLIELSMKMFYNIGTWLEASCSFTGYGCDVNNLFLL